MLFVNLGQPLRRLEFRKTPLPNRLTIALSQAYNASFHTSNVSSEVLGEAFEASDASFETSNEASEALNEAFQTSNASFYLRDEPPSAANMAFRAARATQEILLDKNLALSTLNTVRMKYFKLQLPHFTSGISHCPLRIRYFKQHSPRRKFCLP